MLLLTNIENERLIAGSQRLIEREVLGLINVHVCGTPVR